MSAPAKIRADGSKISASCVIALHREGLLAHTTLNSIRNARKHAEAAGISVQCVVTLDRSDDATKKMLAGHPLIEEGDIVDRVEYGDLGLSRNHGIALSSGEYVLTLDGDDYYSENFIASMVTEAAKDKNSAVFPEFVFCFDADHYCYLLGGPADPDENSYNLFSRNHFASRVAAHRSVFGRNRYAACPGGFGFEDWHWICEARAKNITLNLAAGTVLFYRHRPDSMFQAYAREHALIPPSRFFETLPVPASSPRPFEQWGSHRTLAEKCAGYILRLLPKKAGDKIYKRLRRRFSGTRPGSCPPAVLRALLEVASVDGRLHPKMTPRVPYRGMPDHELLPGMIYARIRHSLKTGPFDVVYLGSGVFADGVMFANYMRAAVEAGKRVLCIITGKSTDGFSHIPAAAEVLEFGRQTEELSENQKDAVLARLLVQLAPPVIHAVNDWRAFELIKIFGTALKHQSRIFASIFSDAQDDLNIHYGPGTCFLRDLFPFCSGIINDNMLTALEWSRRLGLPSSFFHPVYGAVEVTPGDSEDPMSPPRKILWAGRLDAGKRLDILIQIARSLPDIQFDVFGGVILKADPHIGQLKILSNVAFRGADEAFSALPHGQYACLVYTTQYDGMPNVILEAVAHGLPVVAPARGGIADFISDDTGWLINDHEDVAAFCQAICTAVSDRREVGRRCANARRILQERHSFAALRASLLAAYGA
ncbi:MAG: glycosyltransferase [Desulfovibrio sp.]|jgi:glycosyltransferase involved in cell wall biosynthesis|nr:glycosyltransferase [Desulfovibrio sp.]